jgi:adenylate cyclase
LWNCYLVRAELQTARELGEQILTLAQHQQDSALLVEAHRVLGTTLFFQGELTSARTLLEQGIALYDRQQHQALAFLYGADPGVVCQLYAALALWLLGYSDQSLNRIHSALNLARELSHPFSLAFVLSMAAALHQLRRDLTMVQDLAEASIALCTEQQIAQWWACGTVELGWTMTAQGQGKEGIARIQQGLAAWRGTGAQLFTPYYLALLAGAKGKAEQIEEGLVLLDEALNVVHKTGEHMYEAELYRLKGELLRNAECKDSSNTLHSVLCTPQSVEAYFHQAIDKARQQQAKLLELRATLSLGRLWQKQGKKEEAQQRLMEVYGWFTEGSDTSDLQEAKSLLEALGE